MEPVARCTKCGRLFVTLPLKWPAFDVFFPQDTPRRELDTAQPCGGEIALIKAESKIDGRE